MYTCLLYSTRSQDFIIMCTLGKRLNIICLYNVQKAACYEAMKAGLVDHLLVQEQVRKH